MPGLECNEHDSPTERAHRTPRTTPERTGAPIRTYMCLPDRGTDPHVRVPAGPSRPSLRSRMCVPETHLRGDGPRWTESGVQGRLATTSDLRRCGVSGQ